jgi:hypothetical protein
MAPFTFGHCPVCAAETRQHCLLPEAGAQPADSALQLICEQCHTVLTLGDDSTVVAQRPATEEERAAIPVRPQVSEEQRTALQEEFRQGLDAVDAWFQAGCPGLTAEMVQAMPLLGQMLANRGMRPPDRNEPGQET